MTTHPDEEVVKSGTFLYDGTVLCDLRIVRSEMHSGSGDYEDSPELAEDQYGEFFDVQYGSTTELGRFNSSGGSCATLEEAIALAESAPGIGNTVKWID